MRTVTIFGGSGFVGRSIVQKLAAQGDIIRVAVRNPVAAQFLKPLGEVGQITPVHVDLSSKESLEKTIQGSDVVINLVGILFEKGSQTFEKIHVEGAKNIAQVSSKLGVPTFLHMSALGANKASRSRYAATKARGEEMARKHFPKATIFRPSVIFGPEDAFLNRFARMALMSPFLPLIGGGKTRFQPIYVGDVADCFVKALEFPEAKGKLYELGGPSIYTFKELMVYLLETIHRKRLLLSIPFPIAKMMGRIAQWLPTPPLTADQVELLKADTVVSPQALTVEDLEVFPKALQAMAPLYLASYRLRGG